MKNVLLGLFLFLNSFSYGATNCNESYMEGYRHGTKYMYCALLKIDLDTEKLIFKNYYGIYRNFQRQDAWRWAEEKMNSQRFKIEEIKKRIKRNGCEE